MLEHTIAKSAGVLGRVFIILFFISNLGCQKDDFSPIADLESPYLKEMSQDSILVFYWDQTQCADPWGKGKNLDETLDVFTKFLLDMEIQIFETELINDTDLDFYCRSCECGTGKRFLIKVSSGDEEKMLELGFKLLT